MNNDVFAFQRGDCTDIEYLTHTHIGDGNPGQIAKFNIFKTYAEKTKSKKRDTREHYFYVIKRANLYDSYCEKYAEFKIIDLNPATGTVILLYKERFYDDIPTVKQFWNENKNISEVSWKIDYYLDIE